jgi:hypothetical protein
MSDPFNKHLCLQDKNASSEDTWQNIYLKLHNQVTYLPAMYLHLYSSINKKNKK